jgi:hypothetical protein
MKIRVASEILGEPARMIRSPSVVMRVSVSRGWRTNDRSFERLFAAEIYRQHVLLTEKLSHIEHKQKQLKHRHTDISSPVQ